MSSTINSYCVLLLLCVALLIRCMCKYGFGRHLIFGRLSTFHYVQFMWDPFPIIFEMVQKIAPIVPYYSFFQMINGVESLP